MTAKEIRQKFLDFFKEKGHEIVPSAPIVIKNDPTLMFTNAGMNQFKDFFLGHKSPESTKVADTQKCLRVSGKHNDLEEVGFDTYHHTMFEMLGNWSFGDYFKPEGIAWAWELLTKEYGLPEDRLYASVFGGDKEENLTLDQEAFDLWKNIIPEDRIVMGSKKDNFWEMGDTGPCGPCSEIHIDLRPQEEVDKLPGKELVNQDHPQVVEVWNLVFIEYNRKANGELESLPAKHVDTGMGLERLVMAIQGKYSNYDTDLFQPLIASVAQDAGVDYGNNEETDIALRVVVDHLRAVSFAIADGQLPSNTGAGYVIRRILRRAVRYGYTFLDFNRPFIKDLVPILANQVAEAFPELKEQSEFVSKVIEEEETSFLSTLEKGLKRLEAIRKDLGDGRVIPGEQVFELYDTYGFPVDLTALIAREHDLSIDEKGYEAGMAEQKQRSKADAARETGDWTELSGGDVEFVGYDHLHSESRILKYRTIQEKDKEKVQVVLDRTPFYAESGGQVGDKGYLQNGDEKIKVFDTQKENDLIVHFIEKLPSDTSGTFNAVVDSDRRLLTMNNHSATHLMHAALRQVLGSHVEQRGSLVNDKLLRFDFSHFSKMSDEEIQQVEQIVNARIRQNIELLVETDVPIEEAKGKGAMALFGEKYGDTVRVVTFDKDYSVELCGGTHVAATGQIGFFKIISESSIAAGIRRIEAITALVAEQYLEGEAQKLSEINALLKDPKDLVNAVSTLVDERSRLAKELEKVQSKQAGEVKQTLINSVEEKSGVNTIIKEVSVANGDLLKKLSFELKNEIENLFLVLAADVGGKPQISVVISEEVINDKDLDASKLVRELAKEIEGGGGGQPFFATAGGKNLSGLPKVVEKAEAIIQ